MLKRKSLADKLKELLGIGKEQEELFIELEEILIMYKSGWNFSWRRLQSLQ